MIIYNMQKHPPYQTRTNKLNLNSCVYIVNALSILTFNTPGYKLLVTKMIQHLQKSFLVLKYHTSRSLIIYKNMSIKREPTIVSELCPPCFCDLLPWQRGNECSTKIYQPNTLTVTTTTVVKLFYKLITHPLIQYYFIPTENESTRAKVEIH